MTLSELELVSKIHDVISSKVIETGSLKLSKLSSVFSEAGIDRSIYQGTGPKKWVTDNYPEFTIEGSNGREAILFCEDRLGAIASILQSVVNSEGKILLSFVPRLLVAHGFQYKDLSEGLRLSEWIAKQFTEFKIDETGLWLTSTHDTPHLIPIPEQPMDRAQEVQQMHAIAFMNWWSVNVKKLRAYNPQITSEEMAKATIATHFAYALLGEAGSMVWVEEEQRIVFRTGLSKTDGEEIYCVLVINPKNDDGTKQTWALMDFGCASDNSVLGKWLKSVLSEKVTPGRNLSELKSVTAEISNAIDQMARLLADYCATLEEHKIPVSRVRNDICAFEKQVDEYLSLYKGTLDEECRLDQSIMQIAEQLEEKTSVSRQLMRAVELFCNLAENVHRLLSEYNFPIDDNSTPRKDILTVRDLFANESVALSTRQFEKLLRPYCALRDIMYAPNNTDDIGDLIETIICPHFSEISYRNASRMLICVDAEDRDFIETVDEIMDILSSCTAPQKISSESNQHNISAEELLERIPSCKNDGIAVSQYATQIIPDEIVERSLVFAEVDKLKEYIYSHDTTSEYDVNLVERISEVELSTELTYYAAGERLYLMLGNRNGLAEKYFILGLVFDRERSGSALLDLYRESNQMDKFAAIFVQFIDDSKVSLINRLYYLSILCRDNESAALEYADEHYYLFYMPESIDLLCALSDEVFSPTQKKELLRRRQKLTQYDQMNAFETALLTSDVPQIRKYADDPALLLGMGYSEDQVSRIVNATRTALGTIVHGNSYDIGCRFFLFQKNYHGLAERYMWSGMATKSIPIASDLMLLLAQESRFNESCMLYEHYQGSFSNNSGCRRIYLISKLKMNPLAAESYIRANLQDVLDELYNTPLVKTTIEALAADTSEETSSFYSDVLALSKYLADPLLRSIALLDRTLREYTTASYMKEFPVEGKYISGASSIYKSENYAHGADAYSIAARIFAFCGTYNGAAEAFAKFSLPDNRAINLLCDIYTTLEDDSLLFALMSEYPYLREKHHDVYRNGLFRRQLYSQYISEYDKVDDDYAGKLQLFIAALKVDEASDIPLPDIGDRNVSTGLDKWFSSWGSLLSTTLLSQNRISDVEQILFEFFDGWLSRLPADTVKNILTGNGTISSIHLSQIQNDALLVSQDLLALYIYKVLEVGDLSEHADAYFDKSIAEINGLPSDEEKLQALCRLSVIYGDSNNQLNSQISILRIRQALTAANVPQDEVAENVATMIREYSGSSEIFNEILLLLSDSQVATDLRVCKSIDKIASEKTARVAALEYYHARVKTYTDTDSSQYLQFVLQQYVNAFVGDYFPDSLREEAYNICYAHADQTKNETARFCLYFLERLMHHDNEAKFILRELADTPSDVIGETIDSNLAAQLSMMWGNSLPSYLALFKEVLESSSLSYFTEFIAYAGKVSVFSRESVSLMQSKLSVIGDNRMLSESDSDDLIRLLYINPKDVKTWNLLLKLPLQDNPLCYAKIQILVAEKCSGAWEKCITYCEKYDLEELLLSCLNRWVRSAPLNQMNQCREFLEKRISSNPEYLLRWSNNVILKENLLQMSNILCDRLNPAEAEFHATVRSISLIAEKTGLPEALDYLLQKHSGTLFGRNCNLAVVTVAHLLLDNRFEEAEKWLALLGGVLGNMNYRWIVNMLAGMDADKLQSWAGKTENSILLQLILPDGNRPGVERIANITYTGIIQNKSREIASVLLQMLNIFPDDYGFYNSLYDVCCTKFDGYLPVLHKALRGLVRLTPSAGAQIFYRRKQDQYARMLAILDAVIIARNMVSEIADYSFEINTGDYYRQMGAANTTPGEVILINELREKTINHLLSLNIQTRESVGAAYIGYITGNWRNFLLDGWLQRKDIRHEMEIVIDKVEDVGFARSALYVISQLNIDERPAFVRWIQNCLPATNFQSPKTKTRRISQVIFIEKLLVEGIWDKLCIAFDQAAISELIDTPFEDYSLLSQFFAKYTNNAIMSKAPHLYDLMFVMGGLVCHNGFLTGLLMAANKQFDIENDYQANQMYRALYDLNRVFGLVHTTSDGKPVKFNRAFEQYETRCRLTALFLGNKEIIDKISSPELKIWSCTNLVLSLIYSVRADEVLRLISHFSTDNAIYAKALLYAMNQTYNDQEKVKALDTLPNDVMRAYYCYVVKSPFNPKKNVYKSNCVNDTGIASTLNQRYISVANALMASYGTQYIIQLNPSHTLLLEQYVHPNATKQKDPALWMQEEKAEYSEESEFDFAMPAFVEGIEPIEQRIDFGLKLEEYKKLPRLTEYIATKLEMSKEILQHALVDSNKVLTDAILLYGCDRYYTAISVGDMVEANSIIFELAKIIQHADVSGYGFQEARIVLPNGLYNILNAFCDLDALLDSYTKFKTLYNEMRNYVGDPLQSSCIGTIYDVLGSLGKLYLSADHENPEVLRSGLSAAYTKLETIEANRWMELKNKVQKLINAEIYELDRRPTLQVAVHNIGTQRSKGCLHGKVRNIGQIAAENVILQANYGNGMHSSQYILDRLSPGSQAVFVVDYACDDVAEELAYYLNLSYTYEGKSHSSVACKGVLHIGELALPDYPIVSTDPNGLLFSVNENGEVYNSNFVGRRQETAILRGLLNGNSFVEYQSAMVYGIRRSGKSSLLNYLSTYIRANFPDIICLHYDCQTLPEKNCIQHLFVDYVLDQVESMLPDLSASDEWDELKKRWSKQNSNADQNMASLMQFYPAVKKLIGNKGIYFIIDEIDRLFEKIENSACNLEDLFGVISAMLSLQSCREAIHFVICGSNWLIRYNLRGDKKNQLLQRFGKQVIEVGKLREADAKELVVRPYKVYTELTITEEAVEWIWNYTGGLVWHTKLLADTAIEHAKAAGRYAVYASDVQASLADVLSEQWCKQFYEGCESGNEFKVVDAMQSLTARRNAYVHMNKLCELLQWENIDVQKACMLLKELKVVATDPVDPQKYRFEMDMYRRFFRSQPSAFPRVPEENDMFRKYYTPLSQNNNENKTLHTDGSSEDNCF